MDLIDRDQAIKAVKEWEKIYTWDEWCNEHKEEKEKHHIIAPSDVLKELQPALPSGAVITTDMLEYCSSVEKLQEKINKIINSPSAQPLRWIPTTERLPDNDKMVVVTILNMNTNERRLELLRFHEGCFVKFTTDDKVLAWIYSPEPYYEEKAGE